ncbi:cytochrome bc complex cytochrome b subunit [Gammaproteobacteria bacterium AB-CW1]|uniref:Cytochrome b n=1 Tax=Natronospira elongata TaxID=3110268 RepID=A0AAP6JEX7_9GAMM|nr:cytochrome bc complex cytochrome b subunit [Gammaproteobacteria bacterium AB-CW1]
MQNKSNQGGGTVGDWINDRLPYRQFVEDQLTGYYAPKNFNFWYFFGSLALLVLVIQIVTGIFLTMSYKPSADDAFASVEYIMRDVEWGWLIRYMHSTGASMFFLVVYLHMFRGLMYGSYKKPRELLWIFGMLIYVVLMAEAFFGYLLPWGQMSYWGAQVIISLFSVLPGIGEPLAIWIRGDYLISDVTLNRFFALHVVALPLVLIGLIFFHLVALRQTGSNNPDGIEIKENKGPDGKPVDGIPFHPYYTVKDIVGVGVFLALFFAIVFFAPTFLDLFLKPANFIPADPLQTPEYVPPVWYFTPFYAILAAIPDQVGGVIAMGLAILVLFAMPWIDRHPVKSIRYRSFLYKALLMSFAFGFIVLGYLGLKPATTLYNELALRFTEFYFMFFIISWVYSEPRSRNYYYGAFAIVVALIAVIDLVRDMAGISWIALLIMIAVTAFFLLLPAHTRLNESKPVPERLTS